MAATSCSLFIARPAHAPKLFPNSFRAQASSAILTWIKTNYRVIPYDSSQIILLLACIYLRDDFKI